MARAISMGMTTAIEKTIIGVCLLLIVLGLTVAGVNFIRAGADLQAIECVIVAFVVLVLYTVYERRI